MSMAMAFERDPLSPDDLYADTMGVNSIAAPAGAAPGGSFPALCRLFRGRAGGGCLLNQIGLYARREQAIVGIVETTCASYSAVRPEWCQAGL